MGQRVKLRLNQGETNSVEFGRGIRLNWEVADLIKKVDVIRLDGV
jgi:hypothetical protein